MHRIVDFISRPRNQIRWWAAWTVVWIVLDPISVATNLQNRVWWISQMSDFANFASCGTALVAAWSYFRARRVDESLDMPAHIQRIEDAEDRILDALARNHGVVMDALTEAKS